MLSEVCKERLEYLASLKGHVGQAVTMCRVELSDISTELLSLREQLAELKALGPSAWMDDNGNVCTVDNRLRGLTAECSDAYRKYNIPLFTAAKPSVENDIAKFMDGVKNSMAKEVAKVIQKEALLIMFDEITPDTETISMQYESLVKRINCTED
ncbi:hypothetical protein [Yersinia canariae]|uniref:hypothetical protein n=1 Tax=Yersinia canariae TaxID=2607663 RepID=UPI0011A99614|nr:hypothetical protein [Yersinia canariae]